MNSKDYKRIVRMLKATYAEMQQEALETGISIGSSDFQDAIAKARELVLAKEGFTIEQYREIKAKVEAFTSADIMQEVESIRNQIKDLYIPSLEEMGKVASDEVKRNLKAPEIINKIVREVTIQQPQIVKETTIERTVQEIAYNEKPILQQLENLDKRLNGIIIPETIDIELVKSDLKLEFGKMLQHNIDILGMPDFRKLAMGLQAQIDALGSGGGSALTVKDEGSTLDTAVSSIDFVGTGVTATHVGHAVTVTINGSSTGFQTPTGTVNGSNTVFVFSVAPNAIVVDGVSLQKTAVDTTVNWTGTTTITLSIAPNFDIYGVA